MQQAVQSSTREGYLALEETAEGKHEYYQGRVFAMTGGTFNHAYISGNIYVVFKVKLRGKPCQPMNSDMRIHTPSGLDTYPDVSAYCDHPELIDNQQTLLNPVLIVEVLSLSTRNYDKGDKFTLYRAIPSLQDYVLVESEKVWVEHFRRTDNDEWILHEYRQLADTLPLNSIAETLTLTEIYQDVVLEGR